MNITANTQLLAQELRILAKVAPAKAAIPILSHALLHVKDGALRLSATDLELALDAPCAAQCGADGAVALPAKALLDIVERLPDADIVIDDSGRIASGSFRSRLQSLLAADFPRLPSPDGAEHATLPARALRSLAERTIYAISEKEQKYVLKGALLSLTGEVAAMVATDGKRLSVATAARSAGPDASVIVPLKTLGALLDQAPLGEVKFSRTDRHLFFDFGRRLLVSRMIEGEFPKYQRVIPKANNHVATVDRGALAAAIRRVGLVAEALIFTMSQGEIGLASRSAEFGDAEESVPAKYDGPEIKANVNWKYVLDFLEHATEPVVTIAAKDNVSPLLLTDGADFINVVMVIK